MQPAQFIVAFTRTLEYPTVSAESIQLLKLIHISLRPILIPPPNLHLGFSRGLFSLGTSIPVNILEILVCSPVLRTCLLQPHRSNRINYEYITEENSTLINVIILFALYRQPAGHATG
jgi:hypothetical protein